MWHLTDLQRAFYGSMPLEFRLCNTAVLLATTDPTARYDGYLDCKPKVVAALSDSSFDSKRLPLITSRLSLRLCVFASLR